MAEQLTHKIPAEDIEAMVRISAQLEARAEPLRTELRELMRVVADMPARLWTGCFLGIIVDILQETHPKNEVAGAVIGIGVAMLYRAGAELAPISHLVTSLWDDFERMTSA